MNSTKVTELRMALQVKSILFEEVVADVGHDLHLDGWYGKLREEEYSANTRRLLAKLVEDSG